MLADVSLSLVGSELRVTASKRGFPESAPLGLSFSPVPVVYYDFDISDIEAVSQKVSDLSDTFDGDVCFLASDCGGKFENNVYRAKRTVRDLLLCNDFELFGTFTLNDDKRDRFDIDCFKREFPAWIKAYNRYHGCKVEYVLVPEQHLDGAWHMHGVFRGLPDGALAPFIRGKHPLKLVEGCYMNWEAYEKKFGFCSFGKIRDKQKVSSYISAYVTKALTGDELPKGSHLYLCSKGLKRPETKVLRGARCHSDPVSLGFYENDFCWIKSFPLSELEKVRDFLPEFDFFAVFGKAVNPL